MRKWSILLLVVDTVCVSTSAVIETVYKEDAAYYSALFVIVVIDIKEKVDNLLFHL